MKVEQMKAVFPPVCLTLESQVEVDIIKQLLGKVRGAGSVSHVASSMYDKLVKLSTSESLFINDVEALNNETS